MKRHTVILIVAAGVLISSCSLFKRFDFDLSCNTTGIHVDHAKPAEPASIWCTSGGRFRLKCVDGSLTHADGMWLCTTVDGKKVRIRETTGK